MMLRFPLVAISRTRMLRIPNGSSLLNRLPTSRILNSSSKSNYHLVVPAQNRLFSISTQKCHAHTTIRVPAMAESITEGTLVQLNKKVGDFVEQDEELATIETDKIDISINVPHTGVIQNLLAGEGDTVTVDQTIAELQHADEGVPESSQNLSTEESGSSTGKMNQEVKKSQEHEMSIEKPSPSTEYQNTTSSPAEDSQSIQNAINKTGIEPGPRNGRKENRVKMTRIRQKTAQHLKQSQNTAAFLTTFNEVDMSQLMEFRKMNREGVLKEHGIKLGYMGAMARASALALKEIPAVNAAIEDGDTIVYRDYVDLSVAAAIPKGLVTPVLRNIESMGIVEIEKNISTLVAKARDGKLTMNDLMGGSFTISNSGIWGSLFGTPIINMPQTAVLGVYGIQDRPIAVKGQVEIRPMMYIALTYDHRIIDGREAVKFLNIVKGYLEEPSSMLLV